MKKLYTGTSLTDAFKFYSETPSDINEHLQYMHRYAQGCDSILELGVRTGRSTVAWMMAKPKKLTCVDLKVHKLFPIEQYVAWAKEYDIDFKFIENNSLEVKPRSVDLLFIDTYHTYTQLKQEMELHMPYTKKYAIFHDTSTYGDIGEDNKKPGLQKAINEYLKEHSDWNVYDVHLNNNGLTILKRG